MAATSSLECALRRESGHTTLALKVCREPRLAAQDKPDDPGHGQTPDDNARSSHAH